MNWNKIKLRKSDALFSKYIRRGGVCAYQVTEKCNLRKGVTDNLQASHFHGRRMESVRFDLDNVDPSCPACHKFMGEHKYFFENWKKRQLGDRFNALLVRARTPGKRDDKLQEMIWSQKLKELEGVCQTGIKTES